MKTSAGLIMYKRTPGLQLFLVHPGGPFWKNKDKQAWSIPKGEVRQGEDLLEAAKREFKEETGIEPKGRFISLGSVRQRVKTVHAWAFEGDWKGILGKQEMIKIEFPPHSGKKIKVPEIDQARFFPVKDARDKMVAAQTEFIKRIEELVL